jgi:hypothetical protein
MKASAKPWQATAHLKLAVPHLKARQHRPKDFLLVAFHVGLDTCQQGGSNKVALLIPLHLHSSAIKQALSTLQQRPARSSATFLKILRRGFSVKVRTEQLMLIA